MWDLSRQGVTDTFPSITVQRSKRGLEFRARDAMGSPRGATREEFVRYFAAEKALFGAEPIVYMIYFEPGITMIDLDVTTKFLADLGVHSFVIGELYAMRVR